ncbi:MAG TPA: UDP-3-O-(3-hydroxymyristoyl)glucosamine N-acyltransferase [Chitinophagaceae bacterium]|nr:UDP-3-O-(3-hydroxymyristoyl)glucosamine N-acyltransferase [Chitinophagaceae bacterium]
MHFNATQIASLINGKIEGDATISVSSFGKIENAQNGQLAFLANPKYEEHLYTTHASIIIINESQEIKQKLNGTTLIRVQDAYSAFATILASYKKMITEQLIGIQQPVFISDSAKIGENVFIGAFSYIGDNVVIGDNVKIFPQVFIGNDAVIDNDTILYPGVKVYHECIIGKRVAVHANTIIGSDGFGFAPQKDGTFKKVPQIGNVVIEDDVEIGANATIDRATLGSTLIKSGAKLDNLIQIAHNVEVGNNTVIAAQAGISGSTKIGTNVMIGGQAGLVGHIQIADGVKIGAQSGVQKSIKVPDSMVVGSPASDYISALRGLAIIPNLPDLKKRIMELEQVVQQLLAEKISG